MTNPQITVMMVSWVAILIHSRVVVQGIHLLIEWHRIDTAREIRDTAATVLISALYVVLEIEWLASGFTVMSGPMREMLWLTFEVGAGVAFLQTLTLREYVYLVRDRCAHDPQKTSR